MNGDGSHHLLSLDIESGRHTDLSRSGLLFHLRVLARPLVSSSKQSFALPSVMYKYDRHGLREPFASSALPVLENILSLSPAWSVAVTPRTLTEPRGSPSKLETRSPRGSSDSNAPPASAPHNLISLCSAVVTEEDDLMTCQRPGKVSTDSWKGKKIVRLSWPATR
jgi:hypothetical protein